MALYPPGEPKRSARWNDIRTTRAGKKRRGPHKKSPRAAAVLDIVRHFGQNQFTSPHNFRKFLLFVRFAWPGHLQYSGTAGHLHGKGGSTAKPKSGERRTRRTRCSGGAGVRGYGLRGDAPAEPRWDSRWILDVMPWTGKPYRYPDADRRASQRVFPSTLTWHQA